MNRRNPAKLRRTIRPKPLKTRASRHGQVPPFPEIAPHERDAAAFWARRIATSLAIGNGAGIVALSGFLSNAENLENAAAFTYRSFSFYLSGLAFAFISFFVSLAWASMRLDAAEEYFTKLGRMADKAKAAGTSLDLGDMWKARPIVFGVFIFMFFLQLVVLCFSGLFFYLGSAAIVGGMSELACTSSRGQQVCGIRPTFPFSLVEDVASDPVVVAVTGNSSSHGNREQPEHWVRSLRITPVDPTKSIHDAYFFQWVRLSTTNRYGEFTSCYIEISSFFSGDELSYDRRAVADRLINFSTNDAGTVDVRPAELEVSVVLERDGKLVDSQDFSVTGAANGAVGIGRVLAARPGLQGALRPDQTGFVAIVTPDSPKYCVDMVRRAGVETVNQSARRIVRPVD